MDVPNQSDDSRRREEQGKRLAIIMVIITLLARSGMGRGEPPSAAPRHLVRLRLSPFKPRVPAPRRSAAWPWSTWAGAECIDPYPNTSGHLGPFESASAAMKAVRAYRAVLSEPFVRKPDRGSTDIRPSCRP